VTSSFPASALPRLRSPFAAELHRQTAVAESATLAWADRFGLAADPAVRRRLAVTRSARLAGRVSPQATLPGLLLNADWQTWLFLFDDAYCDESDLGRRSADTAKTASRVAQVLETGQLPEREWNPFLVALADLRSRLLRMATPEQFDRFVAQAVFYLLALTWEAAHREHGTLAGFAEYVSMRRHSGGVPTCLALIDVINGFELRDPAWSSPRLRALTDAATDITCWANDILSYPKEVRRSTEVLSLPAVLARENGLPIAQAIAEAARLHDERIAEYQKLESPLMRDGDEQIRGYLADLRHWISGNLAWSYETGRYALGMAA
jgi:hypothetical protein